MPQPREGRRVTSDEQASRSLNIQRFFESKRAAAVFKHAILSGYVVPFASKTGSASTGNRVVVVDGYAGAGRYDSGESGSPALIAAAARGLRGRSLECFFVEKDAQMYERLCSVLAEEDGSTVRWEALRGTVEEHLDAILQRAEGLPLFIFLDPFGLGLPFDVIVNVFKRRPRGPYVPATEVLFRFDAGAIRRIRGVLHSDRDYPARAGTIIALDRAAGGTWWRDNDNLSLNNEQYVDWFMSQLLDRICKEAKCSGWSTEVWQRQDLQPVYYLVFLTRHREGLRVFGEALSLAADKWRRAVFDEAVASVAGSGQGMLMDPDELFKYEEQQLAAQWEIRLEQNIRSLLQHHESFIVGQRYDEVFEGVLGLPRIKHLRVVLKKLHVDGVTSSDSKGALFDKHVTRAQKA
jgi:three-Cys-motif partner protein